MLARNAPNCHSSFSGNLVQACRCQYLSPISFPPSSFPNRLSDTTEGLVSHTQVKTVRCSCLLNKESYQSSGMEEGFPFHLALPDVLISLLSLLFFLLDVVLDLWAIDCLYKEEKYSSMGLLIFFLLSSSILVQTYSWLWYSDSSVTLDTKVERFIKRHGLMAPVHICQLSVFLRFALFFSFSPKVLFLPRELFSSLTY